MVADSSCPNASAVLSPSSLNSSCHSNLPAVLELECHFVLHLLSGQSRQDDFRFHLEPLINNDNFPVVICSVDIVHHALGDLTNLKSFGLWTDLTLLGVVLAILGGPPCETWSAVRFKQLRDESVSLMKGPRPLRSIENLWGLPILSGAGRRQVAIGSALLRAMIQLSTAASKSTFIMVIMEHLKRSWLPQAPSSWMLPELTWVKNLPNTKFCRSRSMHVRSAETHNFIVFKL